jgi:hypothetical protein
VIFSDVVFEWPQIYKFEMAEQKKYQDNDIAVLSCLMLVSCVLFTVMEMLFIRVFITG